jgi:hypothetical protein
LIYDRLPRETDAEYILRIFLDPWFEDATPLEIADFTGLPQSKVRRVLFAWVKSSKVRLIHTHATAVAEQIGWPGTPEGLLHLALERYAQRFSERQREASNLDKEIQEFVAEHRVASD